MHRIRKTFKPAAFICPKPGCRKACKTSGGLKKHIDAVHCEIQSSQRYSSQSPTSGPFSPPPRSPTPGPFSPPPRSPTPQSPPSSPALSPHPGLSQSQPPDLDQERRSHVHIDSHTLCDGTPCDIHGDDLPPGSPHPPWEERSSNDFSPYESQKEFEFAEFLYTHAQMSAGNIDKLLGLLDGIYHASEPPFADHKELYSIIDATKQGDMPWESFSVVYGGEQPDGGEHPPWQSASFEVWFRNPLDLMESQIGNRDFAKEMDFAPKRIFNQDGKRQYTDLMSGNWAWKEADKIAEDSENHGAMLAPIILGSDKTTVSVATGNNEYYPLYASIGNVHNPVRRAHRNAIALLGFLAIPKTSCDYKDDPAFRKFRRQLFHSSLHQILLPLRPHMLKPRITRCADGHFRRVVYSLGPYIADYPEQVLLACIVTGWCPRCTALPDDLDHYSGRRSHQHTDTLLEAFSIKELWENYGIPFTTGFPRADIHELLSPDLLHQLIKGTFKDHLVDWVMAYIEKVHLSSEAARIKADIDRRIAAAPSFPGLRRFPEGRGFKQWTGDDSKALMKVFLPAIAGHVPCQMVRAIAHFIEFCYIARRSTIDEDTLVKLDNELAAFHRDREIFRSTGVRPTGFSLPRQHSLVHYRHLIQEFGAPNGLCSSITESKHIKAVKQPWRRSSRHQSLGQMLLTNQRLDKIAAARVDFTARHMMDAPCTSLPQPPPQHENPKEDPTQGPVEGPMCLGEVKLAKCPARHYPRDLDQLAAHLGYPELRNHVRRFLYEQTHPDAPDVDIDLCPEPSGPVFVYHSAVAMFYAPSDLSGIGGMHRERIRAVPSWRKGPARNDCVFLEKDENQEGFRGMHVARVHLLFSITHQCIKYPCAWVSWFSPLSDVPCPDTGMWVVEPDLFDNGMPIKSVIHLDCVLRAAHLLGLSGEYHIPQELRHHDSLDAFRAFFVNKYADHQAHEIAF